ncbi:hypothetical protein KO505_06765 [Psychrosphaera sp. F3M07]|uniref:hypothetical protein n=1 Tax=Psychrosphaera sp. F3M07 TaxID=2841560 RepID=UPI001C08F118|nr:hypothetical protein [Psychrosphaera sp. F3M07]MBU2917662.1 hypothetical protein [Psychrosphaera sp. F3M07]
MELSEERKREVRANLSGSTVEEERNLLKLGAYEDTPEIKEIVESWVLTHEKMSDIERKDETLALLRETSKLAQEANDISSKANTRSLIALTVSTVMLLISALTYLKSLS